MDVFKIGYYYASPDTSCGHSRKGDSITRTEDERFMAHMFHGGSGRSKYSVALALFWICGILCGASLFLMAGSSNASLMRGLVSGSVSIVGLLGVTVLPFLISAYAVSISEPKLLFPVCFGKAFCFSYVSAGILWSFGSAGWLIRWLLMFSEFLTLPVLYGYWQRHISGKHPFSGMETGCILALLILIGSVDYRCISPFLAMLINS